jgi:hypothetical protein
MRFEPGNTLSKGRPRGARNKRASRVLQDLLEVWDEPITEGSALTRGRAALRLMSRERPSDFAKLYAGIMPREFWVESVATSSVRPFYDTQRPPGSENRAACAMNCRRVRFRSSPVRITN